jgi:hypothetical protein
MPTVLCPACKSAVKYSSGAEPGSTVTCAACDEVFTPPQLEKKKAKAYDPTTDEDVYKMGKAVDDTEREERAQRADRIARSGVHAARREREQKKRHRKKTWFEGPEVWLLIAAVGLAAGLPFGLWLSRNWETMGVAKVFWLFVVLIAIGLAAIGLGGSAWAWLRRNRD